MFLPIIVNVMMVIGTQIIPVVAFPIMLVFAVRVIIMLVMLFVMLYPMIGIIVVLNRMISGIGIGIVGAFHTVIVITVVNAKAYISCLCGHRNKT